LEIKKRYAVNTSEKIIDGVITYWVNDNKVSKLMYQKFKKDAEFINCCPCIQQYYSDREVLLFETVSCSDCEIGWFKSYYPNGNLKLAAHHKENPTNDWSNIYQRGYCSVPDGVFTYFNENGDTLYSEYWKNGEFINQVPEQQKTEIWKTQLLLDGKVIDPNIPLTPEQVSSLSIQFKFKNQNTTDLNIEIEVTISAEGYKQNFKKYTLETFKHIDIMELISEVSIPENSKTTLSIYIKNSNKFIFSSIFPLAY
jgi:hypothetical protein